MEQRGASSWCPDGQPRSRRPGEPREPGACRCDEAAAMRVVASPTRGPTSPVNARRRSSFCLDLMAPRRASGPRRLTLVLPSTAVSSMRGSGLEPRRQWRTAGRAGRRPERAPFDEEEPHPISASQWRTAGRDLRFSGFTHYCRKTRNGGFGLGRKPIAKRVTRTLKRLKERLRARMHDDVHETAQWLGKVVNGWLNYYAVPTSSRTLCGFVRRLEWNWLATLRRRSQKTGTTMTDVTRLTALYWPPVRARHPPATRFAVNNPR